MRLLWRFCIGVAACAVILSCAPANPVGVEPTTSRAATAASRTAHVHFPRFHDHDPVEWGRQRPHHYPIHGIDVSRWQGAIDWHQARRSGVSFAFLKATEGGDVLDPQFKTHWRGARRAGVPRGAYHYFYFCRSAVEQARWFMRHVPKEAGALPHVLDMEWNHRSKTCTKRPSAAKVRAEARRFLSLLERHYGTRPVIYTTVDFYRDTQIGTLPGTEFWLRSVAGHPSEVYPGQHWTFWQYTGTGAVPGIAGKVDINVFAGSPEQWRQWAGLVP